MRPAAAYYIENQFGAGHELCENNKVTRWYAVGMAGQWRHGYPERCAEFMEF